MRISKIAVLQLAVLSGAAQAGGLYVGEFGQPNQGASRAGAHALAEDASTAAQNPAGIMFLDGNSTMVTVIGINSEIEFDQHDELSGSPPAVANADGSRPASDGGDAGGWGLGAASFHASQVNDKWGWGVALASVSGAILEHEDGEDFAGRYWATDVELLTITLLPSLSYKLTDDFSVGLGVPVMIARLDMDVAVPGSVAGAPEGKAEIEDGDDLIAGVNLSAHWRVSDATNIGMQYVSEMELDFDSDLSLTLPPGELPDSVESSVEFVYPQTLRASLTHTLNPQLTLLTSVAWEEWSAFEDIAISTPAGTGKLRRDWDDTWHYALGLRWKPEPRWTYYTGVAYDTDPTQASDRTTDQPIDEQWRYSAGVTYNRDKGHTIGAVLTYADYGDAAISNGGSRPGTGNPWTVNGDYSSNRLLFIGLNYSW